MRQRTAAGPFPWWSQELDGMTFPQSDFPRPGSPVRAYLLESQLDVWAPHGVCTGREVPTQKCFGSAELDSLLLVRFL